MDHLPQLTNQTSSLSDTPFYARYQYHNDGSKEFYQQRNMPPDGISGPDLAGFASFPDVNKYQFGRRPQEEDDDSAFFQAWLYFGTLTEVLRTHEISLDTSDFCRVDGKGRLWLSTRCLGDYIAAWIVKASREHGAILEKDQTHYRARISAQGIGEAAGTMIGRAIVHMKGLTEPLKEEQPRSDSAKIQSNTRDRAFRIHGILRTASTILTKLVPTSSLVQDTVWDSVLILCSTLQTTAYSLYRSYNFPFKFAKLFDKIPARQLEYLFDRNGWCPRERKIVRDLAEGDSCVLFTCAQHNRRGEDADHADCNVAMCHAYQVKEAKYRTLHVSTDCRCEFIGFGKSAGSCISAISQAVSQPPKSTLNLPSLQSSPMIRYENGSIQLVEILLVGGDAKRYKLPFGQAFAAISHVWAHGLGNPQANSLPRCQVERVQRLVNALFPNERKPVPFWIDTLCIPVDEESRKRALVRMEAIYKTATKILVLDRTLYEVSSSNMSPEEVGLRIMCSPWARRLWTLSEGSFQSRVVYRFKDSFHRYEDLNSAVRVMHAFPSRQRAIPKDHFLSLVLADPPNCRPPLDPLWKHAHKALSCTWPRISTFFKEMSISYQPAELNWLPGTQLNPWIQVTVPRAIRTVMSRTTSKVSDECRVFASLTHWWSGSAKMFEGVPQAEHYRKYFRNFGCAPTQLIFLNQRRYTEDGSRWIPTSLLSQTNPDCNPLDFEHKLKDDEFGWHNSHGLEAEYPGFTLTWDRQTSPDFPASGSFRLANILCAARIYEAGTRDCPASLPSGNNLALIVPRSVWQSPNVVPWMFTGVLVTVPTKPSWKPLSSTLDSDGKGMRMALYDAVRVAIVNHRDRDRIIARHEALVELKVISQFDIEGIGGPPYNIPLVQGHPMSDYSTNVRWRVG